MSQADTHTDYTPEFAFAETCTYEVSVTVETMAPKGGVWRKDTFIAEFKRVEIDDLNRLQKRPPAEVLDEVLVGWRDMRGADRRNFVEFTPERKAAFLRIPAAVLATFNEFVATQNKARTKN